VSETVGVGAIDADISGLSAALDFGDLDVVRDIAPDDPMHAFAPDLYFSAGASALRAIRLGMLAGDVAGVASILDFACGWGRVLRFLKAAFPTAALTASDVWGDAVEWCAKTIGCEGLVTPPEPADIRCERTFELIWCGSLLSHVGQDRWTDFLRLFESALRPQGLLVFTVYGREVAHRVRSRGNLLNLTAEQAERVLTDLERSGFGFEVTHTNGTGDALVSRSWVCEQLEHTPSLRLVTYAEGSWMTQDVICCVRADSATS